MISSLLNSLARPNRVALLLGCATGLPVIMAGVLTVQIAVGAVPEDSMRLMKAPAAIFLHALAGVLFGITGPLQFTRALQKHFGRLHRLAGRVFVLAGVVIGVSGLTLLAQVDSASTPVLAVARGLAGVALLGMLARGVHAIRHRHLVVHRACMIRAYAVGMGSGTIGLIFVPVYAVTGAAPRGLGADAVVVGWWLLNVIAAEVVIRRREVRP
jgi:uncharacterized membrane protein